MYYRAITKTDQAEGSIKWSLHTTPFEAYKKYVNPEVPYTCRMLFNGLVESLNAGRKLIRIVNHDDTRETIWIQVIQSEHNTLPEEIFQGYMRAHESL